MFNTDIFKIENTFTIHSIFDIFKFNIRQWLQQKNNNP
jgi:hypothetical protein